MGTVRQSALMENTLQGLCQHHHQQQKERRPIALALLASHWIGTEQGLHSFQGLSRQDVSIRFSAEQELTNIYSINQLREIARSDDWIPPERLSQGIVEHIDVIFIPILSLSLASNLLAFNSENPFAKMILQALLAGKKVIAVKLGSDPYHSQWQGQGMDKGSSYLKRKLSNKLHELRAFGIELIEWDEKIRLPQLHITKGKLITESTIVKTYEQEQSEIFIPQKAIITPLAIDKAKELSITLIYE